MSRPGSWVTDRLLRLIGLGLALCSFIALALPFSVDGIDVAGLILREADARLTFAVCTVVLVALQLIGIVWMHLSWVRAATALATGFALLWAVALLLESWSIGVGEPLGELQASIGLWLYLGLMLAVLVTIAADRGTPAYATTLLQRSLKTQQPGHHLTTARQLRTALHIMLRRFGENDERTMHVASEYGIALAEAGLGDRAKSVRDQLYAKSSALGTENTDPQFMRLRSELSRQGIF